MPLAAAWLRTFQQDVEGRDDPADAGRQFVREGSSFRRCTGYPGELFSSSHPRN